MTKRIISLILIGIFYSAEITNIQVQQRTDGSGIIDVTYDLLDSDGIYPSFNINLEMSIDEGEYTIINSSDLSGDVGENVIPGVSKSIQIQAPSNTYSNNVLIKIIASSTVVSGELPFTMISISSVEGVSSYQFETIDYSFQIMQYELTNADLVTFLETYDFNTDENGQRIYNCSDYTEYYFNENETSDNTDIQINGCDDPTAVNYYPEANYNDNYCIWEEDIGCDDPPSANFSPSATVYDCSCYNVYGYSVTSPSTQGCEWSDEIQNAAQGELNTNYNYEIEVPCTDPAAFNYASMVVEACNDAGDGCCEIISEGECNYNCNIPMLEPDYYNGGSNNDVAQTVNISDFNTEDISYEGLSFVISSGNGSKPVLFDYNRCVDGVIVSLLLEYYGLRLPTGSEWTKASRQDNNRCWPWMNTDCASANTTYCSDKYNCMTEEEFQSCEDTVNDNHTACQEACNQEMYDCQDACNENQTGDDALCSTCMSNPEIFNLCAFGPCTEGCPCCEDCTFNDNTECYQGCDTLECNQNCNDTYGDPYEYCGGQEMQECEHSYNDCTNYNNWSTCVEIQRNDLDNVMNNPDQYDPHGFIATIYANKFNNVNVDGDWGGDQLLYTDVGQYPEGLSPFGLYDVIGNAPELVKQNNVLWLTGLVPTEDPYSSFCSNGNDMFSLTNDNSHAKILTGYEQTNFNYYSLRLARTTQ